MTVGIHRSVLKENWVYILKRFLMRLSRQSRLSKKMDQHYIIYQVQQGPQTTHVITSTCFSQKRKRAELMRKEF